MATLSRRDRSTPLVLLHGALGSASHVASLYEVITRTMPESAVHLVEFSGHGESASTAPFAMDAFVSEVVAAIDAAGAASAQLFGYSMGGYVALLAAAHLPARVASVVTLGTKLRWDPETAEREAQRLDPAALRAKVPRFAESLEARHARGAGWESVVTRTAALLRSLGENPPLDDAALSAIRCPVRLMVGDRDATVSVEETADVYRRLAAGQLAVLPHTQHPLEQASLERIAGEILDFRSATTA